ncbi:S-adenosyl-L-methionine:benzoic acid/salicylic acid carboxyl methyltransferase 3-like [Actinidia eriantha]|uniref:S-adenosyl-L-methionine:benzoic acid/salicylic acid carboxyl methyltransferase 3-like n=1 Tax=Actinidia eriantha TaxID=165200 RepID=UPI002587AFAC|nr:S-adenosyl-L-methionine:benzoic acid/salicylic acid carboxyl methyltransferase 3-like [Actinidia eriantha]
MEVVQVLHMNGGIGETSYASNSSVQKKVISLTKPITEQAIVDLYHSTSPTSALCIADLGCSSGPNALLVVSELMEIVHKTCKKLAHRTPEFQVHLNDLPGNDFNTIFRFLPSFQEKMRKQLGLDFGPCYVTAVPGSFYGRLFQSKSLHFVHSSYSLMWLSQVPKVLETNKGNIYMGSTSPPSVIKAYYEQFQKDFSLFLKCRSEELVSGGRMVLTILGRKSDDPSSKEGCYIWELLATALNEMVSEGLIEEEMMDSFNIPQYTPSPTEVKREIEKEGSFTVDRLEVSSVEWSACGNNISPSNGFKDDGYNVAKCMRAVAEPLLASHFGEAIIDEVFRRYKEIITDRMAKETTEFFNVTVSMIRK